MIKAILMPSILVAGCYCLVVNAAETPHDIDERIARARHVSQSFTAELSLRLKQEISTNGPVSAISVCQDIAPTIANKLSLESGWQVTRVSARPRNTMIGVADSWEQGVLTKFVQRLENGEGFDSLEHVEIVDEPFGKSLRYLKAIETKGVCLVCHGTSEQISQPIHDRLNIVYPQDSATGFKLGQIRGAISIKQPLYLVGTDD